MVFGLFGCDLPAVDECLHVALVLCELHDALAGRVVIDTAVAYAAVIDISVVDNRHYAGGTHTGEFGTVGCAVQDALVGSVAGRCDGLAGGVKGIVRQDILDNGHGEIGSGFAAVFAAHSVADGYYVAVTAFEGDHAVLVVLARAPYIRGTGNNVIFHGSKLLDTPCFPLWMSGCRCKIEVLGRSGYCVCKIRFAG